MLIERQVLPNIPVERGRGTDDLFDQLDTCPDTRFHAVHLFHRYFLRVAEEQRRSNVSESGSFTQAAGGSDDSSEEQLWSDVSEASSLTEAQVEGGSDNSQEHNPGSSSEDSQDGDDDDGAPGSDDTVVVKVSAFESESESNVSQDDREAIAWDIALESLALSVKVGSFVLQPRWAHIWIWQLHRDFLTTVQNLIFSSFRFRCSQLLLCSTVSSSPWLVITKARQI